MINKEIAWMYLIDICAHSQQLHVRMHKWMRKDSDARRNRVNKIFFCFISFYYSLWFIHTLDWWVKFFFYILRTFSVIHRTFLVEICIKWTVKVVPRKIIVRCHKGWQFFIHKKTSLNLFKKYLLASSHLHIFLASEFYFLIFFFFYYNTIFCCSGNFWNSLMSASCCLELKQTQIRHCDSCVC